MPHLQRERDDLLKEAEKIAGFSDSEGQVAPPPKRRNRHGPAQHADNVILSSKFVVESMRDRFENDDHADAFWMEFPRADAETLEKRGVEILTDPATRPPRKKIAIVKVAEPTSITRIDFPQKRTSKGKPATETRTAHSPTDRGAFYHLSAKDFEWLTTYNHFCTEKKWPKISPHDLEAMLTSLDVKKNELTLTHLKSLISAANKTTEDSAKRHEKDYFLLQKLIAFTPNTFDHVEHFNVGRSLNMTSQTAFDVWEYWKLRLQDNFYQPLVFPSANIFDYRRISLLAAWNMTTINYAQRLRHDAERIRLMYDLLQKRNYINMKVMAREEELSHHLAELCTFHPEVRSLSSDLLSHVLHYMHELSAQHPPHQINQPTTQPPSQPPTQPLDHSINQSHNQPINQSLDRSISQSTDQPINQSSSHLHQTLRDWVERLLGGPVEEATAVPSLGTIPHSPEIPFTPNLVKPVIFPPLEVKSPPNIRLHHPEDRLMMLLKGGVGGAGGKGAGGAAGKGLEGGEGAEGGRRPRARLTRGRSDLPKNLTFEHADNSCCENGPMDEDDVGVGRRVQEVGEGVEGEEPLYMINQLEAPVVLQEIYCPPSSLKATEFRTRLRSWKKSG